MPNIRFIKIHLFFLILGIGTVPFFAQSQVAGEATYQLQTRLIGSSPSGRTTLYFDAYRSLFRCEALPQKDSMIKNGMIIGMIRSRRICRI